MIDNNELINQIKSYNRFLNIDTVNKAYNFAVEAHQNQKRDEGVPYICLLYTSPSPRDRTRSRMPSSA